MKVGRFDLPFLCSVFVERKAESGVIRWVVCTRRNVGEIVRTRQQKRGLL